MIGTTLKLGKVSVAKNSKLKPADGVIIFMLFAYCIGFIIGVLFVVNSNETFCSFIDSYFETLKVVKGEADFLKCTVNSFLTVLPFLAATYIFGTGILGIAFIPPVCLLLGSFFGMLVSRIYNVYAVSGIGFCLLNIIPFAIAVSYIIILASRESVCFSDRVLKNALPKGTSHNLFTDFKVYNIRFLLISSLAILASVGDAVLTLLFFRFFNLE